MEGYEGNVKEGGVGERVGIRGREERKGERPGVGERGKEELEQVRRVEEREREGLGQVVLGVRDARKERGLATEGQGDRGARWGTQGEGRKRRRWRKRKVGEGVGGTGVGVRAIGCGIVLSRFAYRSVRFRCGRRSQMVFESVSKASILLR